MNNAELIFSTFNDGYSLENLYRKCSDYKEDYIVIIVKNDKNYIFGAFVDSALSVDAQVLYRGTRESFVFSLSPKEVKYQATGFNDDHLRCDYEYFSIGSEG